MYCDNPTYVYNKYLGHTVLVPCGKCESCLITRSNALTARVSNECDNHPYNVFFTLTYTNDYLPVIDINKFDYVKSNDGRFKDDKDLQDKCYDSLCYLKKHYNEVRPITNYGDNLKVAVLIKSDLQKFLKRLRSSIDYEFKQVKEKEQRQVRYFACGEYGTDHVRCHFHGIIHCDDKEVSEFVIKNIPACWKMCDWDKMRQLEQQDGKKRLPSYIRTNAAASYVASYVSCLARFSSTLEKTKFKSFCVFSKRPLYGVSKIERDILQNFVNGDYDTDVYRKVDRISASGTTTSNVSLSSNFLRSLFPRFCGIDSLSDRDKFGLCLNDSDNRQKHQFVTKCKYFCLNYLGGFNYANINLYLIIYKRLVSRVKSFLLSQHMGSFDFKKPIEYIKSCYHTFEENRPWQHYRMMLYGIFGFDPKELFMSYQTTPFGVEYYNNISKRKDKYQKKLYPKHMSHILNHF